MFMTGQATTAAVDAVAKTWNASGFNLFLGQCGDDDGDIGNILRTVMVKMKTAMMEMKETTIINTGICG